MPKGRKITYPLHYVNDAIVSELHDRKLKKWRKSPLARPTSYLERMLFAVRRLPYPIDSMSNDEIKKFLEDQELRPATRFEVVRAINEVLKYKQRAGLPNPRPKRLEEVSYLPLTDFLHRSEKLPTDYRVYLGALYAVGARYAELPRAHIMDNWAYIGSQLRKTGQEGPTKNKRKRHAAILPPLKSFILAYKGLPQQRQDELRTGHYDRLYKASTVILGANIHTLRHSYAIECIRAGKSLKEVAEWIGDSEKVAKENYIGYIKPDNDPWK